MEKQLKVRILSKNQVISLGGGDMGNIIKEPIGKGKAFTERAPYADSPVRYEFEKSAKTNFKEWALKNTAVTFLDYPDNSDWQLWVRLSSEKYTSEKNVEAIACHLGQAYKTQTGFKDLVIVTVWDKNKDKIYAKGIVR
jgi:hypothetical protein